MRRPHLGESVRSGLDHLLKVVPAIRPLLLQTRANGFELFGLDGFRKQLPVRVASLPARSAQRALRWMQRQRWVVRSEQRAAQFDRGESTARRPPTQFPLKFACLC
jgi:hypothetical protein